MDDLSAMITSVLSDPEKMKQFSQIAQSLGLSDGAPQTQPPPPPAPQNQQADLSSIIGALGDALNQNNRQAAQPAQQAGTTDISALAGILSSALNQNQSAQSQAAPQTPDLSTLAGLLGGAAQPQPQSSSFDVSALTNMFGGPAQGSGGAFPGLDMSMIMKLGQAMSSMQANRQNIDFLLSLKPRLNASRSKKIDDSIKIMQVIQFLPLLKDSGLFSGLDSIIGGFTGNPGGLGGILGDMGIGSGGLGGILNSLLGRR